MRVLLCFFLVLLTVQSSPILADSKQEAIELMGKNERLLTGLKHASLECFYDGELVTDGKVHRWQTVEYFVSTPDGCRRASMNINPAIAVKDWLERGAGQGPWRGNIELYTSGYHASLSGVYDFKDEKRKEGVTPILLNKLEDPIIDAMSLIPLIQGNAAALNRSPTPRQIVSAATDASITIERTVDGTTIKLQANLEHLDLGRVPVSLNWSYDASGRVTAVESMPLEGEKKEPLEGERKDHYHYLASYKYIDPSSVIPTHIISGFAGRKVGVYYRALRLKPDVPPEILRLTHYGIPEPTTKSSFKYAGLFVAFLGICMIFGYRYWAVRNR